MIFKNIFSIKLILLGLTAGFCTFLFERIADIYDSKGISKNYDYIKLLIRTFILLISFLVDFNYNLTISKLFLIIISINSLGIIILLSNKYLYKENKDITKNKIILFDIAKNYLIFAPMIILAVIYQLITRVTINADLGITEQGVYGIAFNIFFCKCSICISLKLIFILRFQKSNYK